ncbi:MAG: Rap1a/Tai family immunity protein [Alphaproteobacteria bacterium]
MRLRPKMLVAMQFAAVLSMGLFFTCGEGFAENPLSANSKIGGCRNYVANSGDDLFSQGYCAGAVEALVEFAAGACAPKTATNMQSVQIVVKYIDARPVRLHESFNKLAAEALRQAWPCTN